MLLEKIKQIRSEYQKESPLVKTLPELENLRIKYLSRNGLVSELFDLMKEVPREEKPATGRELNSLRDEITSDFNRLKEELENKKDIQKEFIDTTLPGEIVSYGSTHILTKTLEEIKNVFKGLGFSVYEDLS